MPYVPPDQLKELPFGKDEHTTRTLFELLHGKQVVLVLGNVPHKEIKEGKVSYDSLNPLEIVVDTGEFECTSAKDTNQYLLIGYYERLSDDKKGSPSAFDFPRQVRIYY